MTQKNITGPGKTQKPNVLKNYGAFSNWSSIVIQNIGFLCFTRPCNVFWGHRLGLFCFSIRIWMFFFVKNNEFLCVWQWLWFNSLYFNWFGNDFGPTCCISFVSSLWSLVLQLVTVHTSVSVCSLLFRWTRRAPVRARVNQISQISEARETFWGWQPQSSNWTISQ